MNVDHLAATVCSKPNEANTVRLLDEWSSIWKREGRTRAVGSWSVRKVLKPWTMLMEALLTSREHLMLKMLAEQSINHFLRSRFPAKPGLPSRFFATQKWGFIETFFELERASKSRIHTGSFSEGRVWVENKNGNAPAQVQIKTSFESFGSCWH